MAHLLDDEQKQLVAEAFGSIQRQIAARERSGASEDRMRVFKPSGWAVPLSLVATLVVVLWSAFSWIAALKSQNEELRAQLGDVRLQLGDVRKRTWSVASQRLWVKEFIIQNPTVKVPDPVPFLDN